MISSIRIAGTGSALASRVITNRDLAHKIRVDEKWIEDRTGIRSRCFAAPSETAADLGAHAAHDALRAAGVTSKEIDCVLASTLSPDRIFPGLGVDVQAKLKCHRIPAIDVSAQCNGFVFGLSIAAAYILSGQYRRILLVASEIQSRYLEINHKNKDICVLFGDGAGAAVIEADPSADKTRPVFELHSDGHFAADLSMHRPAPKKPLPQPVMNKTSVIFHSSRSLAEVTHSIMAKNRISHDEVDFLIPHQSNKRLIEEVARRCDFPMSKVVVNIETAGNTSSASIPIALDQAVKSGRIRRGDRLLFVSFGAGFSWGAAFLTY